MGCENNNTINIKIGVNNFFYVDYHVRYYPMNIMNSLRCKTQENQTYD